MGEDTLKLPRSRLLRLALVALAEDPGSLAPPLVAFGGVVCCCFGWMLVAAGFEEDRTGWELIVPHVGFALTVMYILATGSRQATHLARVEAATVVALCVQAGCAYMVGAPLLGVPCIDVPCFVVPFAMPPGAPCQRTRSILCAMGYSAACACAGIKQRLCAGNLAQLHMQEGSEKPDECAYDTAPGVDLDRLSVVEPDQIEADG